MKREVLAKLSEAGGSCHSGFRRNDGVSDFRKSLKRKLFGAEHAKDAEVLRVKARKESAVPERSAA
jgi:hypothetical protein